MRSGPIRLCASSQQAGFALSNEDTLFQSDDQQTRAQQASLQATPELEGYQLRHRLGAGAFGEVWGGTQNSTGQRVAVKFFLQRNSSELDYIRRELERLREVCDHPSVVSLIDADLEHRPAYFVMPWLGRSLEGWPDPPTPQQAAEWMKQLAYGLQHTHDKGLLHCDLKPSNIMLDDANLVRLADFGQSRQQGEGVVAWGTLGYMAPEQAMLGSEAFGSSPSVRWDVYGLGATLYRILSGRCPYLSDQQLTQLQGLPLEARLARYREILLGTPLVPARTLNRRVDQDLSDILAACLRTDPERRLASMSMLLQDLERRQSGEPLLCRQPWSPLYRLGKWSRRPALVASALLATALLAGGVAAYRQQEAALDKQTRLVAAMLSERGVERSRQGSLDEASLWLAAALEKAPDELYLRRALAHSNTVLADIVPEAVTFCYRPDGQELVYRNRSGVFCFAGSGKRISLPAGWTGQEPLYSPRGRYLALHCQEAVLLYDTQTQKLLGQPLLLDQDGPIVTMAFDDQERLLTFHPKRSRLCRWTLEGNLERDEFLQHDGSWDRRPDPGLQDTTAFFSPNGGWMLVALDVKTSCLLDLVKGRSRQLSYRIDTTLEPFSPGNRWGLCGQQLVELESGRAVTPTGGPFACFVGERQVALFDGKRLQIEPIAKPEDSYKLQHPARVLKAVASADGRFLLSQCEGGLLCVWDLASRCLVTSQPGRSLDSFGFVGDGKSFYTNFHHLRRWTIQLPAPHWSATLQPSTVLGLRAGDGPDWVLARQEKHLTALSPAGKTLAVFTSPGKIREAVRSRSGLVAVESQDSSILLWNLPDAPRQQVLSNEKSPGEEWTSSKLAFDAQGGRLAVAGNQQVELWNTAQEPAVSLGKVSCPNPQAVALSPNGRWLAVLSGLDLFDTAEWRVWSLPDLRSVTVPSAASQLRSTPGQNAQLLFHPGSGWLLARNNDAYASLSLPSGASLGSWSEGSWITQCAMSPDGSVLFQPKSQGLGEFRSLPQGRLLGQPLRLGSESQFAFTAAFSKESDVCALADQDTLTLYEPRRAFAIRSLPCLLPFSCAFLDHPPRLLTGNKQGLVQCWDLSLAAGSPSALRRRWEAWTGQVIDEETASVRYLDKQEWEKARLATQ